MPKRILSVGQCVPDQSSISRFLQQKFDVTIQTAENADEALSMIYAGPFDLVLINRIFDRDGGSGIDFIRDLRADPTSAHVPVMLVSNLPDAQERAREHGALPGFGKSEIGSPQLAKRLEKHIISESAAESDTVE